MAIGVRREFLLGRPSNECAEGRLDLKTEFVRLECHPEALEELTMYLAA